MQADAASLDSLWVHLSPDDTTLKTTQLAAQSSASESLKAQNNLNKDINQVCLISAHGMAALQQVIAPVSPGAAESSQPQNAALGV